MITDIQLRWLDMERKRKVRKKDNPQKYSSYNKRIQQRIDHMIKNLLWLAKNRPEILRDSDVEMADTSLPLQRRARALLEAISLFENEPTIIALISQIYTRHTFEIKKKQ